MHWSDRLGTAVIFVLLGPLVGGLWLLSWSAADQWRDGGSAFEYIAEQAPIVIGVSYVAGFIPALATGGVFAILPVRWQRSVIALPVGGVTTWLLWELLAAMFDGPVMPASAYFLIVGAGALAATVCAYTARVLLELVGRRYERNGGIG